MRDAELDYDDWDQYEPEQGCARCDGEGLIVVCPDDMCRATEGCGRFADRSCYRVCPECKGTYIL